MHYHITWNFVYVKYVLFLPYLSDLKTVMARMGGLSQ